MRGNVAEEAQGIGPAARSWCRASASPARQPAGLLQPVSQPVASPRDEPEGMQDHSMAVGCSTACSSRAGLGQRPARASPPKAEASLGKNIGRCVS